MSGREQRASGTLTRSSLGSLLLVFLAACAAPRARPFTAGYEETGYASWYGEPYHGRRTSSGEVYDMHQLTAAHRELPLGTWVMVTNLENGRSVEVRINDRGPFVEGRILDLSYAAARLLGVVGPGIIPVRLRVLRAAPTVVANTSSTYTVQVGSFLNQSNAYALKAELERSFSGVFIVKQVIAGETYYRVRVGGFQDKVGARAMAERLAARGYSVIVVER